MTRSRRKNDMNEFVNLYVLSLMCAEAHKCYDMMNNSMYKNTTANTNVDLNRDLRNINTNRM